MDAFFVDYLDRLDDIHAQFTRDVDDLPDEAMDWAPGPELNSVAVIVAHSMGSESLWIGQMGAGVDVVRVRADEFKVKGQSKAEVIATIERATANAHQWGGGLTLADLAVKRTPPNSDKQYSVAWSLLHALDHAAEHVGHLGITRQLWKLRAD
jgi:uncharacterized damage-inducible protein DinB